MFDEYYQNGISPLVAAALVDIRDFNFSENVPYDYMHLVCLELAKKLLFLWQQSKSDEKLSNEKIQLICGRISQISEYTPCEF